ncbi:MAG: sulfoxide reductase heme-binding subunit YedZ [Hyphomicrobiales bacterium]|nr:sulfoxide reductase heme-binding subunit YedZ [Hyphomicrobiales bacterium]
MTQTATLDRKLPWNDRKGHFSPLKATTLVLVSLPALWLLYRALAFGLGARPFTEAIHRVGDWTIYLLLITLAVTPARRLFDWSKLIQIRRILGLTALSYIVLHFTFFLIDSKFDLVFVGTEIALRIYLLIGFAALLGLVALGVTSTDGWVKRMGAIRWNRLHKTVYVITALGILHYYMQSKVDVSQPVLMTGFFFWLIGYRQMARRGYKEGLLPLVALSVAAALLTAFTEAAWYGIATGAPADRVLSANLDFSFTIRPAWWVLFAGLGITILSEARKRLKSGGSQSRPTAAGRPA